MSLMWQFKCPERAKYFSTGHRPAVLNHTDTQAQLFRFYLFRHSMRRILKVKQKRGKCEERSWKLVAGGCKLILVVRILPPPA